MSTCISFQKQLASILDALSKTAVAEISKLVDIESKVLKWEITRGQNEIVELKNKLQLMESLLWIARGQGQDANADGNDKGHPRAVSNTSETTFLVGFKSGEEIRSDIKSENYWERVCQPSESWGSQEDRREDVEAVFAQETSKAVKDHSEIVIIKEEPSEVDIGSSRPERGLKNNQKNALAVDADARRRSLEEDLKKTTRLTDGQENQATVPTTTGGSNGSDPLLASTFSIDEQGPLLKSTRSGSEHTHGEYVFLSRSFNPMKAHGLGASSGERRFNCVHCGKTFRCFSQLEIHQRSHTGEKPFRCALCGKRYAQKGHLYTHQRTHTGEKPYRCPVCGKGFIQKCTLDMHQRTHTGEKPFVCVKCGKGFTKKCNLKKHQTLHNEIMHI